MHLLISARMGCYYLDIDIQYSVEDAGTIKQVSGRDSTEASGTAVKAPSRAAFIANMF